MDGWTILIWGGVCAVGVLAFLRIVASEVEQAAQDIRCTEILMKREADRDAGAESDEVVQATTM